MKDNGFKDSRLLEAFDHIDPRFIAEVADELKIEPECTPERDKKATRRSIRYALTLAACLLLISAMLPAASYLIGHLGTTPGGNPVVDTDESNSRVIKTGYQVYGGEVYNERIGRLVRYLPATDEYENLCDHKTCPEGCHFRGIECLSQIVDGKLYYIYDSVWGIDQDIRAAYLDLSTMRSVDICDISAYSISGKAYVYEGYYYFSREINLPSNRGELYRIPIEGGDEELVLEFDSEEALFMVAEGEIITLNRYDYLLDPPPLVIKAYNIETGEERVLWSCEGGEREQRVIEPAFLDGKLYFLASADEGNDLIRVDLESGEAECVKSGVSDSYWLMNDGVYYFPFESRTVEYKSMLSSIGDGLYRTTDSASLHYYDLDEKKERVVYKNEDITPCYPSGMLISGGKVCGYFCGAFPSLGLERAEVLISIELTTGEIKALDEAYLPQSSDVTVEITEPETTEEEFEIPIPEGGLTFIEHVGEVPTEFKEIVENNLLGGGYLIGDTIIGYYRDGDRYRVSTKDKYGNVLTSALVGSQNQWPSEVFVDSEKNLIVVLWVNTTVGSAPSGYYKIVKIDPSGKTVFEKSMSTVEAGYDYMFEVDEGYIFVGNCDGEKDGTMTTTDISALLLSRDGKVVGHERIGGDDYDTLYRVEKNKNGVSIYYFRHTKDRNGSYQRCDISVKGNIQSPMHTEITKDDIPDYVYFTIDGKPYYEMTDFFTEYEWNKVAGSKVIEYDGFVLLVYSRFTSDYDHKIHGFLSTIQPSFYYRETVYEAYAKTGELLWRSAVDSTDYDFLREYYYNK